MSTGVSLTDRVSQLIEELGREKSAGTKQGMDDPGTKDGPSTHPSAKADDGQIQPEPEGAQAADDTAEIKKNVPESVDGTPDATPANTPNQADAQQGDAKPVGEDPAAEDDYKGEK